MTLPESRKFSTDIPDNNTKADHNFEKIGIDRGIADSRFPFPYEENLIRLDQIKTRLEKKILSLEKSLHSKDQLIEEIEKELAELSERFYNYDKLYLLDYLKKIEASLRKIKERYAYRSERFNVLFFLLQKLEQFGFEIKDQMIQSGQLPPGQYQESPFHPSSSSLHNLDYRKKGPHAYIHSSKYAHVLISGLNVLIPFHHYSLIHFRSAERLFSAKQLKVRRSNGDYPVFEILRSPVMPLQPQQDDLRGESYAKRLKAILIRWYNINCGVFIDSFVRKLEDQEQEILYELKPTTNNDFFLGRIHMYGQQFFLLDPKLLLAKKGLTIN